MWELGGGGTVDEVTRDLTEGWTLDHQTTAAFPTLSSLRRTPAVC